MSGATGGAARDDVSGASPLAALISPLRRNLLAAARAAADVPDLPDAQIEVIRALPRGTVRRPGELAGSLGLSRSTVSNLLNAMENRGLVARRVPAEDKRNIDVIATPKAVDLFARFDEASATIVGNALAELPESDRAAIADAVPALERLSEILAATRATLTSPGGATKGAA